MPFFRVDPQNPFEGPHQKQEVLTTGADPESAGMAMVLVHGRGATAQSMLSFAKEFQREDIHYRALQANRQTWYPRSFMEPQGKNEPGISSGLQAIYDVILSITQEDITLSKIVLLGFSQGACLATEFAARHPQRFGGVIGLSGGLIGDEVDHDKYKGSLKHTPVFLGCSDKDAHIPQERVSETVEVFKKLEGNVIEKIYPGMGHTVNEDEIQHINEMIKRI